MNNNDSPEIKRLGLGLAFKRAKTLKQWGSGETSDISLYFNATGSPFFAAKGNSQISGVTKRGIKADSGARVLSRTGARGGRRGGGLCSGGPHGRSPPGSAHPPYSAGTPIGTDGVRSSGLGGIAMAHVSPFP